MARERLQNLTEPMYYILLALTKARHGYEIMKTIEVFTQGRVIIGPGTLYALLSRFEEKEFIDLLSIKDRKKTYMITEKGRELLDQEFERLKLLVDDGNKILQDNTNKINEGEK